MKKLPRELYQNADNEEPVTFEFPIADESDEDEDLNEIQPSLDWLQKFEEDWEEALRHWRITSDYRRKKIGTDLRKQIHEIFNDWPLLKTPKAFDLIDLDFRLGGFCADFDKVEEFKIFFDKIFAAKCLPEDDYLEALRILIDDEKTTEGIYLNR